MWRNDIKCKYMFVPLKNLARKGSNDDQIINSDFNFCPFLGHNVDQIRLASPKIESFQVSTWGIDVICDISIMFTWGIDVICDISIMFTWGIDVICDISIICLPEVSMLSVTLALASDSARANSRSATFSSSSCFSCVTFCSLVSNDFWLDNSSSRRWIWIGITPIQYIHIYFLKILIKTLHSSPVRVRYWSSFGNSDLYHALVIVMLYR